MSGVSHLHDYKSVVSELQAKVLQPGKVTQSDTKGHKVTQSDTK